MPTDLHPHDLLDRERRGQLTEEERRALDAHLGQCKVCALEGHLVRDFEVERETAHRDDAAILARSVRAALSRAGLPAGAHLSPGAEAATLAAAGIQKAKLLRAPLGALCGRWPSSPPRCCSRASDLARSPWCGAGGSPPDAPPSR